MADVWTGLADCYASLVEDVRTRYGVRAGEPSRPWASAG